VRMRSGIVPGRLAAPIPCQLDRGAAGRVPVRRTASGRYDEQAKPEPLGYNSKRLPGLAPRRPGNPQHPLFSSGCYRCELPLCSFLLRRRTDTMTMTYSFCTRRGFLGGLALGALAFSKPGAFADELVRTPRQTEGPFYPDKLPLDTDNDLLIINDSIT